MRKVVLTDSEGYLRTYLVRDADPDGMAAQGIPLSPPDLGQLDWEGIRRELHNALVQAGIFSWADIQRGQDAISSVARSVLKRRIVALYREQEVS